MQKIPNFTKITQPNKCSLRLSIFEILLDSPPPHPPHPFLLGPSFIKFLKKIPRNSYSFIHFLRDM